MKLTERELNVIYLSLHLMHSELYAPPKTRAKRKSAKEVGQIKDKINLAWIRGRKSNIKHRESK